MDIDELLALLDIDSPQDLVYFEQFAELMETPKDVPFETLAALAEKMDSDVLSELVEGYFEDVMKFVPDGEDELYTLLNNIATTLTTMASGNDEDSARIFAEELYKFRSWYLFDSTVHLKELSAGSESEMPLMEALTAYRVQSFTDDEYDFDFSESLDYRLDEYIVSLGALAGDYDDDGYDDGDDETGGDEYEDSYDEDLDYSDSDD